MPDLSNIRRILILQYQPFGDVLLNTASLPYLKRRFPDARIEFLVRVPYDTVLEGNPHIDEIIRFRKFKGIRYFLERCAVTALIRRRRYDLVIDQRKGAGSAILTALSGARYRLGYRQSRFPFVYNIKGSKGPVRYYAAMKFDLLKPLGIHEESNQTYVKIQDESQRYAGEWLAGQGLENKPFVIFSPGGPVRAKRWPPELYAKTADIIIERTGVPVVALWAPKELQTVQQMIAAARTPVLLAPRTSFNEAGAFLQRCRLLVCNDGGLNHLAIALGTPSLAMFLAADPRKWSGHELDNHFYFTTADKHHPLGPGYGIDPETVAAKALEIMQVERR